MSENAFPTPCEICGKPVPDYEPEYCCSGSECGCAGEPSEPCVCSDACWRALDSNHDKTLDERRELAGIAKWTSGEAVEIRRIDAVSRAAIRVKRLQNLANVIRAVNSMNGWNVTAPHDWKDTYKVPGVLALIHSEVSEGLEAFRKDEQELFLEEMADVVIRVLDCVGAFTDDFDKIVEAKIEKNRGRGYRHGGKRV